LIPAELPFAALGVSSGFFTVLSSSFLAAVSATAFFFGVSGRTGFSFSTGESGGGGMSVPSVILPKLRFSAGSSKRELLVALAATVDGMVIVWIA
jgi:hypothetical protein